MESTSSFNAAEVTLESVLRTPELKRRPARTPDYRAECNALSELSAILTDSPQAILQKLVEVILEICRAGSAGVSLLSMDRDNAMCYWAAIAGALSECTGNRISRDDCPCGITLDRGAPQLFMHPERHFTGLTSISPLIEEVLLIPFYVKGKAVGTVWIIAHDKHRKFDAEDLRLITSLSKFAAGAYQMLESLDTLKQQGSELHESRELYRTLFESIDEGFCIIQMIFDDDDNPVDYRFLQINPAFARETGLENALGKSMREMIPDHDKHWFQIYGHVALARIAVRFEDYSQTLQRWFSVFAFPIAEPANRQVGLIFSNITERKRAEQAIKYHSDEIQTLLNAVPLGVYLVDADFCIRAVNPIAEPVFPDIPGGVIGRDFDEVIHNLWEKRYADEVVEIFRHTLTTGQPYVSRERAEYRIDRDIVEYYEWRLDRITLPDGRYGVVCCFRDISEEIQTRKEIEQSRDALRETDRRKNEFLAMLAHELRNPLAPIRNVAQILRLPELDARAREAASDMLDRQINQMVRLVDDLLDVSRITRGKIVIRKQRIELASIVNQAIETVRQFCESKHHRLTVNLPPRPIYLDADPARLIQVVGNLLSNAYKFTQPDGDIRLTVERENAHALIRVLDNGIGIADEQRSRIFEMFTQVDTSLERPQSGLGIGLTLVKNLVEMHQGSVEVYSDGIGKGSEFIVRLPVAPGASGYRPAKPSARNKTPAVPRRILVVDDNVDLTRSLVTLLKLAGHDVHTRADGLEAVTAAEQLHPDVILLDIGLPGLNGYEAARRIRKLQTDNSTVLVAMTGWGQEEDRRRSKEAGFDVHMVKPLDLDRLSTLLAELETA